MFPFVDSKDFGGVKSISLISDLAKWVNFIYPFSLSVLLYYDTV
jgi:hypothetical protein